MDLHDKLKKLGWRQGSILTIDDCADLLGHGPCEIHEPVAIIVSHSCDLLNPQLQKFPKFEVALAGLLASPDPNFQKRRNPRVLHLPIMIKADQRWVELRVENRAFLDRSLLPERTPDKYRRLLDSDRQDMALWIGAAYYRSALPDSFQNRLRTQKNHLKKIYREISPYVSDILVSIYPDDDVDEKSTYSATLTLIVENDTDVETEQVVRNRDQLKQILQSAKIDTTVAILPESKATIKLLRSSYRMTEDFWSNLDNDEPLSATTLS